MVETMNRADGIKKVAELIKDIRIAMLTTVADDGQLHSRPMGAQEVEFDGTLWFFTRDDSPKAGDIRREHEVNVAFADAHKQSYVSVAGRASVVHDQAKAKELWNPFLKAWFPQGLETPGLALLKVEATSAEYWDAPHGAVVQLLGLAKALATGKPADDIAENRVVNLERTAGRP